MAKEVKQWITVNGHHVPIFEGESRAEAVKRAVKKTGNTKKTGEKTGETKESLQKEYNRLHEMLGHTEDERRIAAINRQLDDVSKKLDKELAKGKDEDTKEKQIARNKKEADERNRDISGEVWDLSKKLDKDGTASTTSKKIADMYKENKNPNFDFTVRKKGDEYVITAKKKGADDRKASEKSQSKKSNDWMEKIDNDKLWDIAERYNTSNPVSGNWDTEKAHEQRAIAKEFGISMEQSKQVMMKKLGFPEDDSNETDKWAKETANASTSKSMVSKEAVQGVGKQKEKSSKSQKGAELARKQLDFDRPGEYAEISDGHWRKSIGVSNDKMAELMSAQDSKYDYEHQVEKDGNTIHHRMYRVPKQGQKKNSGSKLWQKFKADNDGEWKISKYDKRSLIELAYEAGIPDSRSRAMSTDELRSMLLAMYKK